MSEIPPLFDEHSPLRRSESLPGLAAAPDVRKRGLQRRRRQQLGTATGAGLVAAVCIGLGVTLLGDQGVVSTTPINPAQHSATSRPASTKTLPPVQGPSQARAHVQPPVTEAAWLTVPELSDNVGF